MTLISRAAGKIKAQNCSVRIQHSFSIVSWFGIAVHGMTWLNFFKILWEKLLIKRLSRPQNYCAIEN